MPAPQLRKFSEAKHLFPVACNKIKYGNYKENEDELILLYEGDTTVDFIIGMYNYKMLYCARILQLLSTKQIIPIIEYYTDAGFKTMKSNFQFTKDDTYSQTKAVEYAYFFALNQFYEREK